MTKQEAIDELRDLLDYWRYIKMYNNPREQEAVEFAINYMEDKLYDSISNYLSFYIDTCNTSHVFF